MAQQSPPNSTPPFLSYCFKQIQNHVSQEGIFRISASVHFLEKAQQIVNQGRSLDKAYPGLSGTDAAAVVKKFLLELEQPLLTVQILEKLHKFAVADENLFIQRSSQELRAIPEQHQILLFELLDLFSFVSSNSSSNSMTSENIGKTIGVSLFRVEEFHHYAQIHTIVRCWIDSFSGLKIAAKKH